MTDKVRELFDDHHVAIYRYLRKLTGRPDFAEDLTQEVFLRVIRHADTFDSRGRDRAWLLRIARNLAFDERRKEWRAPRPTNNPATLEQRRSDSQVLAICLEEALAELSDDERDAFLLREIAGLSYLEIASVCGGSREAVRSRIYRARCTLRSALGGAPTTVPLVEERPRNYP